jgi:hypothetical protein
MATRMALLIAMAISMRADAAEAVDEYRVKGAFLLNFAKFVEWPAQAFKDGTGPISICIMGGNPFGPGFEQAARQTVVAGRPVTVREVAGPEQAGQCQIVFVSASEKKRTRKLLEAVQGASVLTVGESEGFLASGGVIDFKLDGERVRIEISTAAADQAKLRISAKLLSLAQSSKK